MSELELHEQFERLAPEALKCQVLDRDNYQCQACGTGGENRLHLHHVLYRSQGGKDVYDNLVTLCFRCHAGVHMGIIDVQLIELPSGKLAAFCTRKWGKFK